MPWGSPPPTTITTTTATCPLPTRCRPSGASRSGGTPAGRCPGLVPRASHRLQEVLPVQARAVLVQREAQALAPHQARLLSEGMDLLLRRKARFVN